MKKVAILLALALELAVCGCGNNIPRTFTNTVTSGNWEAKLTDPTGAFGGELNFVVAFQVFNSGTLDITGFGFFNQGSCFDTGLYAQSETGNAAFTTNISTGQVTGNLNMTITSATTGSVLTLTSLPDGLTGTSNGTTTSTGSLSNGVVVGNWTLSNPKNPSCSNSNSGNTFIMCQGTATCTPTAAIRPDPIAEER